jgi:eukaryotic-like serine/threonine-protein kinase
MDAADQAPREKALFEQALDAASSAERLAFLQGACGGDAALLARVQALLQAHEAAEGFLPEQPAGPASLVPVTEMPGDRIGRYKLRERIGEGGCGVVYVAEQEEPVRRKVALKVIKLGMDTRNVVARFQAERQALALMDHPNIAQVHDAGATDTGRPYFVMELVRGIKITDYCDQHQLSTRERLELFIKVCQAIQHAHQKGVIHRDIKPSNILVTVNDPGSPGVPKVIDFGIAKAITGRLTDLTVYTDLHQFIGTPAYMSPEQASMTNLDIDTRSDIYSLGVLLYELLTSHTPFDTKELMALEVDDLRRTIREREPMRPSTRLSTMLEGELTTTAKHRASMPPGLIHLVRGDLDWIVMKCLEKDRTRRYETANGLARDIERHLNNEPVIARPPSVSYRLQKSLRRNRLVFTASGVVALALVLGVVVSLWQAVRATKAQRVATAETTLEKEQRQRAEQGELSARRNLYASDMLLAQQVREEGNLDLTLNLLNRHRPAPGEADLRGWEWRYLWNLCQSDEVATFATNSAAIGHLVISPDGTLLSAAEWGSLRTAVKVWGFTSGRLIATPERNDAAGSVAFSPNGKLLAYATRSHGLKIWDIEAQQETINFPGRYGFEYERAALAFSPDGNTLAAAAGGEPQILLWNIQKKTLSMTLRGHSELITSLVFLPNGKTLVSGSYDNTIRLWSLASGQEIARLTNHTHRVSSLALSADGRILASAGWDKTIRIWDLDARLQVAVLTNHTRAVTCLAFSPADKTLASGSWDHLIKLWDPTQGLELSTLRGSLDELYAIVFSPDGNTLISGAKDGMIKTWNPAPKVRPPDVLELPRDGSVWRSRDGTLLCYHTNQAITYVDPATLRQTAQYDAPEESITNSVFRYATPSGRIVWATKQSEVVVWDMAARRQLGRLPWVAGEEKIVVVSPDEKFLVAVAAGKCLTVWDLENWQEIATLPKSADGVEALRFSKDLHLIATGNTRGTVEVWDLRRKERVADWQAHRLSVEGVAFVSDGKRLVTVSTDGTARLWQIETRRELRSFTRGLMAFDSLAVSPDGQRLAARTADVIKIWISSTGQEIAALRVGEGAECRLQFLGPDGNTLISVTSKEARLWRAPSWEEIAAAEKRMEGKNQ